MELLYKANNLEVYFDRTRHYFHCNWIGHQSNELLFHTGGIILDLVEEKSVVKILNNNIRVEGSWTESSEWTASKWFPSMAQAGLLHFAWVLSPDIFAEISARRAVPPNGSVNIQLFSPSNDSLDNAINWLQSFPSRKR